MTVGGSRTWSGPWPRSYLYCPGDRPDRLARVRGWGANAVIADLEDSVHASEKPVARAAVAAWLADLPSALHADHAGKGQLGEVWVRINAGTLAEDVAAVVGPALRGIVLPKAEPALAASLDDLLSRAERDWGLPPGSVAVQPVIETATGLLAAAELASAPRVTRLGIGEADLAAELGVDVRTDPQILGPLRLQLVVASAAAGIAAPVGPASIDFKDLDGAAGRHRGPAPAGLPRPDRHPPRAAGLHQRGVHAIAGAGGRCPAAGRRLRRGHRGGRRRDHRPGRPNGRRRRAAIGPRHPGPGSLAAITGVRQRKGRTHTPTPCCPRCRTCRRASPAACGPSAPA